MDYQPKMLFGTLHYADRCGAKTRGGGTCQNMPRQIGGRCRMHGGNSLRGPEHPRYKEGKYSKYKPVEPMELENLLVYWAAQPVDFSWVQDEPVDLSDLLKEFVDIADL